MSSVDDSYKKTSFDSIKWEPTQKYTYSKNSWFKQINLIIFAVACVLILVISITFITLYFNSRETPQKDLFFNDTAARVTTAAGRVTFADARVTTAAARVTFADARVTTAAARVTTAAARVTSRSIPSTTQASKQERSECFSVKNKCPENQECIRLSFHSTCKCSNGFMNDKNDWTNCICPKNKNLTEGKCVCPENYIEEYNDNDCVPNLCKDPNSNMACHWSCADDCPLKGCYEDHNVVCRCKIDYKLDNSTGKCVYFSKGYFGEYVSDDIVENYSKYNISNISKLAA